MKNLSDLFLAALYFALFAFYSQYPIYIGIGSVYLLKFAIPTAKTAVKKAK